MSRFLSRYTELAPDGELDLPRAIHKITAMAAHRYGLADRGRIRPGLAADLVVFDPAGIRDRATFEDPLQYPDGIRHVLVNGVAVLEGGEPTGLLPGRALRPGRCGRTLPVTATEEAFR
jgi:N-acyl-D-amino-acid deacylase